MLLLDVKFYSVEQLTFTGVFSHREPYILFQNDINCPTSAITINAAIHNN